MKYWTDNMLLNGKDLQPQQIAAIANGEITNIQVDPAVLRHVGDVHRAYNERMNNSSTPVYGGNTGWGARKNVKVDDGNSNAGVTMTISATTSDAFGKLDPGVSKAMLAIQINGILAGGIGAARPELVKKLVDVFNSNDLTSFPRIPAIGNGQGDLNSAAIFAKWWMDKDKSFNVEPGEALALIVGNYYPDALSAILASKLDKLMNMVYLTHVVSSEAYGAQTEAMHPAVAEARPIPKLSDSIGYLRHYLKGSRLLEEGANRNLQDPNSFRVVPHACAAIEHQLEELTQYLGVEINSSTQNPLFSEKSNRAIHNGNFNTIHHSITMSALQLAMAEYAHLSFQKLSKLCDPKFNGATSGFSTLEMPVSGLHALNLAPIAGQALANITQLAQTNITQNFALSFEDNIEDTVSGVFQQSLNASKMLDYLQTVITCELIAGVAGIKHRMEKGEINRDQLSPSVAKVYDALSGKINISGTMDKMLDVDHLFDGLSMNELFPARHEDKHISRQKELGSRGR